ncbi:g13116 [Coccomyxa viridis]|uniref:G13116 protein n=1 Tax=Coccomyxa viridis TaxID=1274662 RepID=A0ABP1GG56_9CHLO
MDHVVPASANVPGLPSLGFPFQNIFNIDGQQKFDTSPQFGAFQKPEGQLITPVMEHSVVPQQSNGLPYRLSTIERQELELARRRAEKAAEGKRANAAQARAKRRASRPRLEDRQSEQGEGGEGSNGEEDDLEAKLANTKDEKEAKRLRRLLRNRVSAQQARERKKSYVSNLEQAAKGNEQQIAKLTQQVKTLERENGMLRQIIKNIQNPGDRSVPDAP